MSEKELSYSIDNGSKESTLILRLSGPFTLSNMFQLQDEMRTLKPACLIMDLAAVPYMDSAAMGVIMNYYVSSQSDGHTFLLAGVNDRVRALLEMTRVHDVLKIYPTVEAAEDAA
jgi:anti-anti-sigma factor